jgi:N-methylhydantoinase A
MTSSPATPVLVGIDIGGTFTDIVLMDAASGTVHTDKLPTTPQDQSIAFAAGVQRASRSIGCEPSSIIRVLHGTTVATNAVLEGKGAATALITTAGFRHVLEIGRHDIPRKANMFSWIKPQRPVPPERIYEVSGRIDVDGTEHVPLDEQDLARAVEAVAADGVLSVAVCLLHSYVNPGHERRIRDALEQRIPGVQVSLSSEVLPVFREYERSMATILNAYVAPAVSRYVSRLDERLRDDGVDAPLLLMKSSGGAMGLEAVTRAPIQTALSGPAAGVLGAAQVACAAGHPNVITIDIGGTSADVCLIRDGRPALTMRGRIGDWPLHTPMVDIVTIGAGGGSIARASGSGGLTVGPMSAGADPGPACYGRGGAEPTVTDAHLVLGRLSGALLGDEFRLDRGAAEAAVDRVASALGLTRERAAEGILDVANHAMVGAIRLVSVERGLDPRDFALLAFGGAGPLHGAQLARLLGMRTVIVPPNPGVLSAYGLLVADIRNDFSRTCLEQPPHYDLARLAASFEELEAGARAWLGAEGVGPDDQNTEWSISLRYKHQGFELTVPWCKDHAPDEALSEAISSFHALHEQLYTFCQVDTPVEVATLHVAAVGRLPRPAPTFLGDRDGAGPVVLRRQTMVVDGRSYECPVYDRASLASGDVVQGPAVIAQHDSTTVVLPDQSARAHSGGSILIQLEPA